MQTILVTGGGGLVGNGIRIALEREMDKERQANEKWIFTEYYEFDLLNRESTRQLFEKYKPDYVVHLAAKVGGLFSNMAYKVEFYNDNVIMNMNVMEMCKEFKVKKLVSCLSTCIFPDKTTYPIDETMVHNGPPHSSNEGYAYAKRMIEVMNRLYNEEYGCNFTSIIPTNIYGLHDNFDINGGHVVPGLIHKFYKAKKENKPVTVWGSGKPLRQFIYNYDIGRLIMWVVREYKEVAPVILSVDEKDEVSIGDVANMIADAIDYHNIEYDTSKADGQYKKTADNTKLRKYLPEFRFTPMAEGIKETVEWFTTHYEQARKG